MLQLKYEHSYKVSEWSRLISEKENLSENIVEIAAVVGLLHDIGRFLQIDTYSTLDDLKSVDHGDLGAEVLLQTKMTDGYPSEIQTAIIFAVKNHNKRTIQNYPNREAEVLTKIVRDADKIDVFRVMHHHLANGTEEQKKSVLLNLQESNTISPQVDDFIRQKVVVNKSMVRTTLDFKLMQLSWIFDFNFGSSLSIIRTSMHYRYLLDDVAAISGCEGIADLIRSYLNEVKKCES